MEIIGNDMPHLRAALEGYAVALRNAYQDNLIRSDRIATGDLLNSIEAQVKGPDGGTWRVVFLLAEYWKYVEDDTRPHWPPRDAILKWIRAKPVIPRPDDKGRVPSPESLAFLISRRIAGESPKGLPGGTKGSHDLERAETELISHWRMELTKALQLDMTDGLKMYIEQTFRELNPAPVEI